MDVMIGNADDSTAFVKVKEEEKRRKSRTTKKRMCPRFAVHTTAQ